MILINNVEKSPKELETMFDIPLDDIIKSSEFVINDNLKGYDLGSKRKREIGIQRFPASFYTEDSSGKSVEIRYAASKANVKDKKGDMHIVYSPRKVQLDGDITIPSKIDLCCYLWLHSKNKQSPFRNKSSIWTYEFVDKKGIAKSSINKGDVMLEALTHAKIAKGKDIKLIAKGMGIIGVDNMDLIEIQAALSNLAMANPVDYMAKVGKEGTMFEGRVLDAIDKNLFILQDNFGTPKWMWNAGANKGTLVCEVSNATITPNMFLVNYIKNNIAQYYSDIINIQNTLDADEKTEAFLSRQIGNKKIEVVEVDSYVAPVEPVNTEEETEETVEEVFNATKADEAPEPEYPTDFQTAKAYLAHFKGGTPSNLHGSQLFKQLPGLTPETIREWVEVNIGY